MLYTRKGDVGTTQLYNQNERISKASQTIEALGVLDELNSYLGVCRAILIRSENQTIIPSKKKKLSLRDIVHNIQEDLFSIQAEVAGAKKSIHRSRVMFLETNTDAIEASVPPLHTFSITGGTVLSAHFDVARTFARKAERRVVVIHETEKKIQTNTLSYLNRLSSLLFAIARYCNHLERVKEEAPTYP